VGNNLLEGAVFQHQLDVHFGFATELGDGIEEGLAVGANGAAERVVGFEYGAELEGQNGGDAEALADHACVIDDGLLSELAVWVVFAYDDGEIAAGIREYSALIDAADGGKGEGPSCAKSVVKRFLFSNTV